MTGRYRAYPEYKPSGVEWLGDVPAGWEQKRLKYVSSYNDEVLPDNMGSEWELEYVDIGSVSAEDGIQQTQTMLFGKAPSRARRIVRNGDILISTVRTYLKAIAPVVNPQSNLVASTGFAVIRPADGFRSNFASYAVRAGGYIDEIVARSVGISYPAINASDLVNIRVPLPSEDEQTQIAAFLDHETAKIETLIAKQQRLIELLEEKRQAVISQAVTKGLNPAAPLRPSGIDWLGDVPEHWELLSLNRIIDQFVDYRGKTPTKTEEGVPLITATQIKRGVIDHALDPVYISHQEYRERMTRGFPAKGDLLLTTEAPLGEAALIDDEYVATGQRIILMKCSADYVHSEYLLRHFQSKFGKSELHVRSSGSTASGIRADRLRASKVNIPPLQEQTEIVDHINAKLSKFKVLEGDAHSVITLLKERRTALISAAVTGKIDVRDWQPPKSILDRNIKTPEDAVHEYIDRQSQRDHLSR